MTLERSLISTVSSPILHSKDLNLDRQLRRSRFRLRLFSYRVQSCVRSTTDFYFYSSISHLTTLKRSIFSTNELSISYNSHSHSNASNISNLTLFVPSEAIFILTISQSLTSRLSEALLLMHSTTSVFISCAILCQIDY